MSDSRASNVSMSDRSIEDRSSRQTALDAAASDSAKKSRRGGKRAGAGRKPSRFRKPAHRVRERVSPDHPVHVTLRMQEQVSLRTRRIYHVIRKLLGFYLSFPGFRVIHISIQENHLHMLVEAESNDTLRRGMQSFAIRTALAINGDRGVNGQVFAHRYHSTVIRTPRQARSCLAYVLNNWRRHRLDLTSKGIMSCPYDPYSSALSFEGWTHRYALTMPAGWVPLPVSPPRSLLLSSSYRRCGLIDPYECPGPRW